MMDNKRFLLLCVMVPLFFLGACTKSGNGAAKSNAGAAETAVTADSVPEFPLEKLKPLLYAAGSVIGWGYADEFDAARGNETDRRFADALLYEFLNGNILGERLQPVFNEETFMRELGSEDMRFLLRQCIGDYPALIQPPAELFIFMNKEGDYCFGFSDKGLMAIETEVEEVKYAGGGAFDVTVTLYELSFDEDADEPKTPVGRYTLRFVKADDSAYGYTLVKAERAGPASGAASGRTDGTQASWKAAFIKELLAAQEYAENFDWDNQDNRYPRYISSIKLADLNFDGTPELILSGETTFASFYNYIYSVSDGRCGLIYTGLFSKGPTLYSDPGGGLFYSFTELNASLDENEEYVFTVYETNEETNLRLLPSGGGEERMYYSMMLGGGNEKYSFGSRTVSEGEYNSLVDSLYGSYREVPGYPFSIADMFWDRDWDSSGGFSENELLRFMDAYKSEKAN